MLRQSTFGCHFALLMSWVTNITYSYGNNATNGQNHPKPPLAHQKPPIQYNWTRLVRHNDNFGFKYDNVEIFTGHPAVSSRNSVES